MKRTIQINLFGTVYTIDEDAHQLLEQYLTNMKSYFGRQAGGDEIADDIEHRVAELFWEIRERGNGWDAISIDQVKEIIQTVGNPEQMEGNQAAGSLSIDIDNDSTHKDDDDHPDDNARMHDEQGRAADGKHRINDNSNNTASNDGATSWIRQRRYYRDPVDKRIGGVIAGACHYFGVKDPLAARLIYALLCALAVFGDWPFILQFFAQAICWSIPGYLLLWMIAPEAVTAEDRLRMKGKPVNPDSLNDELLQAHGVYGNAGKNQAQMTQAQGCLSGLTDVLAFCFKALLIIIGIGLAISVIFPIVLLLAMMCNIPLFTHIFGFAPDFPQGIADEKWMIALMITALITVVGLPIYALCRWIIKSDKKMSAGMTAVLIVIWLVALTFSLFGATRVFGNAADKLMDGSWTYSFLITEDNGDTITRNDTVSAFENIEIEGVGMITYRQGEAYAVECYGSERIVSSTDIYTENGTLHINNTSEEGNRKGTSNISITITSPSLARASMEGVGCLALADTVRSLEPIELELKGVGQLMADYIEAPVIKASNKGVGSAELEVKCETLSVRLEGIGSMTLKGETRHYDRTDDALGHIDDSGLQVRE